MIELRGVSKTVTSGGHPLTILHPLDLLVPSGQFLAIVGPSGSGQSTCSFYWPVWTHRQPRNPRHGTESEASEDALRDCVVPLLARVSFFISCPR